MDLCIVPFVQIFNFDLLESQGEVSALTLPEYHLTLLLLRNLHGATLVADEEAELSDALQNHVDQFNVD